MTIGTESSPWHVPAHHYVVEEGMRQMVRDALGELRMLAAGRYSPFPGTKPVTLLECATSDRYGSISHHTCRDDVGVVATMDDGRRMGWRFARGNGDPVRHVASAMEDDSGLLRFASAMILHLEHALDSDPSWNPQTVLLPATGRAMRLYRHRHIADRRDMIHSQTATPWSRPRVFTESIDPHGNSVAGPNLLPASARRRRSLTAVEIGVLHSQTRTQVTVSPMETSFDPETMSAMDEMRAYIALDGEPSLV